MNAYLALRLWLLIAGAYALGIAVWILTLVTPTTAPNTAGFEALSLFATMCLGVICFLASAHIDEWHKEGYL